MSTSKKNRCFECGCEAEELELYKGEYEEAVPMCKDCIRITKQIMERDKFCADYGIDYWQAPWN